MLLVAGAEAGDALAGKGDYVPLADLETERAKVKALQTALDAVEAIRDERFASDAAKSGLLAVVVARLEAAGLRAAASPFAETSDEALLLELATRGYVGALDERPVELRLTEDEIRSLERHEPKPPPHNRAMTHSSSARLPAIHRGGYAGRCPHCNDLPYDGPTRACPECGIDRHGVGHGAG